MNIDLRSYALRLFLAATIAGVSANAADAPAAAPAPGKPADMTKPVQVFILMGQSNMVGAGKFAGGSARWGKEFLEPTLSVYPGTYDPKVDYDAMKPCLRAFCKLKSMIERIASP